MSKNRRREWLDVTRLEAGHSYRFPLVEFITVLILYISFSAVYQIATMTHSMDTRPGPMWNGTSQIESILSYESTVSTFVFSRALEQLWMTLLFIAPMLIGFTTARAFEDGSLRTLLSYPVKRSHLMLMRILIPVLIFGTITTLSILLGLILLLPVQLDLGSILLLTGTYWLANLLLTSSVVFLSVVTKRMVIAAISGVAAWYGLLTLSYMPNVPAIVSWISNPVGLMQQYLLGGRDTPWRFIIGGSEAPLIGDVYLTFAIMALAIILFLVSSILLFRRMEV